MFFKERFAEMQAIAEKIFDRPELGYKEWETSALVRDFLKKENPQAELESFSTTGIKTYLTTDKPLTMVFIAELDAVYAPSHFNADKETGAAHNCGHFTQVTIALALYAYFMETKIHEDFDYNIAFVFIPAEEYLDLDYRKQLVQDGKITYLGGKPEAMKLGVFDGMDFGVCVHSIGEEFARPTIEIDCDLAGFLYKRYHFTGKASHAGFDPFSGVNAYSMSTLFNVAVGLNRQQFRDDQMVRVNPIVMDSDMSTNVVPNHITVGTDLRTKTVEYMQETAHRLDDAAKGSALALNGQVEIETDMGYLPFVQNRYLNTFVKKAFDQSEEIIDIIDDRGGIAAAGDIGDLAFMFPCIQISYGGFEGTIHGDDFKMVDDRFVLEQFPRFLVDVLKEMNGNIDASQLYKRSYAEYEALIQSIAK